MKIPEIGMGTWGMGGKYESDRSNYKESVGVLKTGLELGFRLIDTAQLYGRGLGEQIVGEAIKDFKREDIFIVSKVWQDNLGYDEVIEAARGSLKRLGIDYIDLYLIHWSLENPPIKNVPLSETMRALEYLADNGLVQSIGVSDASAAQFKEAQDNLDHLKLAAGQIRYNLVSREAEKDIIPYALKNNIKIIANRPLAKGDSRVSGNEVIRQLARKYGKTPRQIALNWIIAKGHTPIPMTMNKKHLIENYGAVGWRLEDGDIELIERTDFSI